MSEKLCNLLGGVQPIIDAVYPVGRTIICNHNPSQDYPWQTWEQDFMDRFPLGAGDTYAAGSTGGEASHTLTVDEMPQHGHILAGYTVKWVANTGEIQSSTTGSFKRSRENSEYTSNAGNSQPHNNMPPYKAVKFWTRTA